MAGDHLLEITLHFCPCLCAAGDLPSLHPGRAAEDRAADLRQEAAGEEEEGAPPEEHSGQDSSLKHCPNRIAPGDTAQFQSKICKKKVLNIG